MSTPQPDQRDLEIVALEVRLMPLSEASFRASESLEFDAALQGVLPSSRSLVGVLVTGWWTRWTTGPRAGFLSPALTAPEAEGLAACLKIRFCC